MPPLIAITEGYALFQAASRQAYETTGKHPSLKEDISRELPRRGSEEHWLQGDNLTTEIPTLSSRQDNKKTARIAGVLYLCVGVFGGFAQGFVGPKIYAAGDAATTMMNVVANTQLVRLGVVADLINQVFFIGLALTLYGMLKHVQLGVARAMLALVTVAVAIGSLNSVLLFEGLQVATDASYQLTWGSVGVSSLVMLLLDLHHYGLLTAQVFFGLWLAPLGYLAWKSGLFPKALASVLVLGAICYLIDLLAAFLVPDIGRMIHGYIVIPCAVAEIWMVLYLLIIGVRKLDRSGSLSVPLKRAQSSSTEWVSPHRSFTEFVSAVIDPIATHRRRRRATLQLSALSDRQLDELGLTRQAILESTRGRC